MGGMTDTNTFAHEQPRDDTGRFGAHTHTAPEAALAPAGEELIYLVEGDDHELRATLATSADEALERVRDGFAEQYDGDDDDDDASGDYPVELVAAFRGDPYGDEEDWTWLAGVGNAPSERAARRALNSTEKDF